VSGNIDELLSNLVIDMIISGKKVQITLASIGEQLVVKRLKGGLECQIARKDERDPGQDIIIWRELSRELNFVWNREKKKSNMSAVKLSHNWPT